MRGKGCADACRAEFVLRCGDACILARFKAYVPLCRKRYITSCDGTARDGQVTLTRSDIGIPARCDAASCVFVGRILHTAVGFARAEADIQGECCVCQRIFLERIVHHSPRLVGIYSFETVVLHLADAADRGIERLSEVEETVTEADGKPCRLVFLCDALAVDVILAIDARFLRCDGCIFICEDIAR